MSGPELIGGVTVNTTDLTLVLSQIPWRWTEIIEHSCRPNVPDDGTCATCELAKRVDEAANRLRAAAGLRTSNERRQQIAETIANSTVTVLERTSWRTREGNLIDVADLTPSHAYNIARMMAKRAKRYVWAYYTQRYWMTAASEWEGDNPNDAEAISWLNPPTDDETCWQYLGYHTPFGQVLRQRLARHGFSWKDIWDDMLETALPQ